MDMDDKTKQALAHSLTASDTGILPHLPYLLQDMWQLGGDTDGAVRLLRPVLKAWHGAAHFRVLDLACGKGAVAITLADRLGVEVKGVDLMPEFVTDARKKAVEYNVGRLCRFEVMDANLAVERERGWDCVVLSASGNVLGKPADMLRKLAAVVRPGGYILLDEGYRTEDADMKWCGEDTCTLAEWEALFAQNGLSMAGRLLQDDEALAGNDGSDIEAIARRAAELGEKYPENKAMFDAYVQNQRDEMGDLESDGFVSESWLLQKGEA